VTLVACVRRLLVRLIVTCTFAYVCLLCLAQDFVVEVARFTYGGLYLVHATAELCMYACEPCVALNLEMKSQVSGGACSDVRHLCTLLSLARARVGCGDGALSVALCYCVVMNSAHDVEGILLIRGVVWRGGGEGMNGRGGDHKEEEQEG
jgi:hypothetical protein